MKPTQNDTEVSPLSLPAPAYKKAKIKQGKPKQELFLRFIAYEK